MDISQLPLNALRTFEAAARHGSFTRAGLELRVSQTAVSHQIKHLEALLGMTLFRRLPRGLALTDEGAALAPIIGDAFRRISATMGRFEKGNFQEVVVVAAVSTFAVGWLVERLATFQAEHPFVDLRIRTNNNRIDLAGEGVDIAIRFGSGSWQGLDSTLLMPAPLSPLCSPGMAQLLQKPSDLVHAPLLRSYRADEWEHWFQAAHLPAPVLRGMTFDSSLALADVAARGLGVALLPVSMFRRDIESARLCQPFDLDVDAGGYWLTCLKSRRLTRGGKAFMDWLIATAAGEIRAGPVDSSKLETAHRFAAGRDRHSPGRRD